VNRGLVGIVPAVLAGTLVVALGSCSPAAQLPPTASLLPAPSLAASSSAATPAPSPSAPVGPTPLKVTPIAGAPASGVLLHLSVKLNRWNLTTLTAPGAKTWQVEIKNEDSAGVHNFVIASGTDVGSRIFSTPKFAKDDTKTYDVPGIPAGTYLFVCTLHTNTMTGTLTLE
jgi:hypothetical protein